MNQFSAQQLKRLLRIQNIIKQLEELVLEADECNKQAKDPLVAQLQAVSLGSFDSSPKQNFQYQSNTIQSPGIKLKQNVSESFYIDDLKKEIEEMKKFLIQQTQELQFNEMKFFMKLRQKELKATVLNNKINEIIEPQQEKAQKILAINECLQQIKILEDMAYSIAFLRNTVSRCNMEASKIMKLTHTDQFKAYRSGESVAQQLDQIKQRLEELHINRLKFIKDCSFLEINFECEREISDRVESTQILVNLTISKFDNAIKMIVEEYMYFENKFDQLQK